MEKTLVVVDSQNSIYQESLDVQETCAFGDQTVPFRITKKRLYGGVQDGLDVVEIDSGKLRFTVLLSKGMNVLKASCDDVELKWDSPVDGPVHPKFVPIFAPNGCGWLEGFCEWIARCGLESNGAPEFDSNGALKYPLHGRLSNLPARYVEITYDLESGIIKLTGEILETSVFGHKFLFKVVYTVRVGSSKLRVEDSVTNLLNTDDEFELLYHINTGYPLVSPGAKFIAPFAKMCPRDQNAVSELPQWDVFVNPEPGRPETCYFFDLTSDEEGATSVALLGDSRERGVSLTFSKKDFPYFILWKTQRPNGDIYVSGMEPAINFPNTRSFEKRNGRVMPIAAKQTKNFWFEFDVLTDKQQVEECASRISALQKGCVGQIEAFPIPAWCE